MESASLWDDPDGVVEELSKADAPRRRRIAHAKGTRRRGGLETLAEQASLSVFGMPQHELNREAQKTLPPRRELGRRTRPSVPSPAKTQTSPPSTTILALPGLMWRWAMPWPRPRLPSPSGPLA